MQGRYKAHNKEVKITEEKNQYAIMYNNKYE